MKNKNTELMSYFEDGTPVQFRININATPNLVGGYYGEVTYFSPTSNSRVTIWFSHNYKSSVKAFMDCLKHRDEFIKDNPMIAC